MRMFLNYFVIFCLAIISIQAESSIELLSRTIRGNVYEQSGQMDMNNLKKGTESRIFVGKFHDSRTKKHLEKKKSFFSSKKAHLIAHDTVLFRGLDRVDPKMFSVLDEFQSQDKTMMDLTTVHRDDMITVFVRLLHPEKDFTLSFKELQPFVIASHVSDVKLKLHIKKEHQKVLEYLKGHSNVIWIEEKLHMKMKNFGANMILQAGGSFQSDYIWRHGVTGKQLVTVGDTGLAYYNCMFYDEKNPIPTFNNVSSAHRKIHGYFQVTMEIEGKKITSDRYDGPGGHGTHVSGTIAGFLGDNSSYPESFQKFSGIAKDSRLVFIDLQNIDYPDELLIPDDLYKDYFPIGQKAGSKIHSNSWGCSHSVWFSCNDFNGCTWNKDTPYGKKGETVPDSWCYSRTGRRCVYYCNTYSTNSQEADQFLYENDDMIILFSAGNDGSASRLGFTLDSPATAKNVLSVGASMNVNQDWQMSINYTNIQEYLDQLGFSSEDECCKYSGPNADVIHSVCCTEIMEKLFKDKNLYDFGNLADFSSRGPTLNDRRIKPDVVGPGQNIISSNSNGNPGMPYCSDIRPNGKNDASFVSMQGTSMSTPAVAGAVALVRDYYMKGFYPSGLETSKDKFVPSGALLKGTIIHSAQPLFGTVLIDGEPTQLPEEWPNPFVGFGLVDLSKVLYFKNDTLNDSISLFVKDRMTIRANEEQVFCFKTTRMFSSEFRATLVWMDAPGSPGSVKQLINDIDLTVFVDEMLYEGNNIEGGDYVNNVEQVRAPLKLQGQSMIVMLHAGKLTTPEQKYSLIVSGGFIEEEVDHCKKPY